MSAWDAKCQLRNVLEDVSSPIKDCPQESAGWRLQTFVATSRYLEWYLSPSHPRIDSKY